MKIASGVKFMRHPHRLRLVSCRKSVRKFTPEPVADELIEKILEGDRWVPSGLNNQSWKFRFATDTGLKEEISKLTHYRRINFIDLTGRSVV